MTTISLEDFSLSPDIVVGSEDHRALLQLATAGTGPAAGTADDLLAELERATVVPSGFVPDDVVRMGSRVSFRTSDGETRSVRLVFPREADIAQGRISVLTPIGTALIGLREKQSITWRTRDGRRQVLTVLRVDNSEDDGPQPPSAA